ncbi:MAG: extracellular solute-binding protein [Limnochordaceae bacterium]|nr:extracellular solute-binding protein [Limnochordaceae bacterium]
MRGMWQHVAGSGGVPGENRQSERRRRWTWAAVVLGAVAAVGIGLWQVRAQDGGQEAAAGAGTTETVSAAAASPSTGTTDTTTAAVASPGTSTTDTATAAAAASPSTASQGYTQADLLTNVSVGNTYAEVKAAWDKAGAQPTQGVNVVIPGARFTAMSPNTAHVASGVGGRPGNVLYWDKEEGWVEWQFSVPATGYYEITLDYYMPPGKGNPAERQLQIDGQFPFREAQQLVFRRVWADASRPLTDSRGNNLRPRQVEIFRWQTEPLRDSRGLVDRPLRFYLTAGSHRLRFIAVREPMVIGDIRVHSPVVYPTYQQYLAEAKAAGFAPATALAKVQAEDAAYKSQPVIRREYTSDPSEEPKAGSKIILNAFGSWNWRRANDWAEWVIDVPADGLYELDAKVWQGWQDGLPVFRRLYIDGKIPFDEAQTLYVPYNRRQYLWRVGDQQGKPYLFALTKGRHVIRLAVTVGPLAETVATIERVNLGLTRMNQEIVMVTGPDPDPNFEYHIEKTIPDLIPRLRNMASQLEAQVAQMTRAVGRRPAAANTLAMDVKWLRDMADHPEIITTPDKVKSFGDNQAGLSAWANSMQDQPLEMDWLAVAPPGHDFGKVTPTVLDQATNTVSGLIDSFGKNYGQVGDVYDPSQALNVWTGRGREWADILKQMIEDDFTPKTGIPVNLTILPPGNLGLGGTNMILLAAVSGQTPDVALDVAQNLPFEFALRGAVVPLDQFPDFKTVIQRFRPGAMIPYYWRGHYYGLPQTQNFQMLFYRADILQLLGLKVPDTWSDVYQILPDLQANGLDFYYFSPVLGDTSGYTAFLYQLGGDYYTPDGLRSALDTPQAQQAFEEWTRLYTNYKVPVQADFYNRMRTGLMPLGVADFATYVNLTGAAPELTGLWGMAPLPGHVRNGQVDRTMAPGGDAVTIFKTVKNKEAAWEFIKWWTSDEVQTRFGNEVEGKLGVLARWNSANVKAFERLPFSPREVRVVLEQWRWLKEVPQVPGGYLTGRDLYNAWNRTVIDGKLPRESLELAVRVINQELRVKQTEFGITPENAGRLYLGGE